MGNMESQITALVELIKNLQPLLDKESLRLREDVKTNNLNKFDCNYWCQNAIGDSLVKLRLFTEQNFNYIETMSLLAVTRYIFEMSVWLKLFNFNSQYGLVYYSVLIDSQTSYWEDCRTQSQREIKLLNRFEFEEKSLLTEEMDKLSAISDAQERQNSAKKLSSNVMKLIDDAASRHFSIYAEQARSKGYSFQAYLIEKKVLVDIEQSISMLKKEKEEFMSSIPSDVFKLIPKRWNWSDMAKKVNLADEYDYIYSYTSMLLHANPSSITTSHKNLELSEMNIFLKYINVKIRDILELSKKYPISNA